MHAAQKAELRRKLLAARAARGADELAAARAAIRAHVLDRCTHERWTCIAAYSPMPTEPGSVELLAGLAAIGIRVVVPVLLPDLDLDWAKWDTSYPDRPMTELDPSYRRLGVDGVVSADAVLVPALAVTRWGVRLGRGGGSYDRALARVRPGVPSAAVVFDEEIVAELPTDPWDRRVASAVTPVGWVDLDG
jgi:5-formyltetrahydrofolate cyclo-ligase